MEERLTGPEKQGMSRATLRLWGIIILALGLLGRSILQNRVLGMGDASGPQLLEVLDMEGGMTAATVSIVLQAIETSAVPIFAVLLVDGFAHTSSVKNYLLRMAGTAVLSELPYNLAISGKLLDVGSRNPMFGSVLVLVMLFLYRYYAQNTFTNVLIKLAVTVAAFLWALMFRVEYGVSLLLLALVFWVFRERPTLRYFLGAAAAVCCSVGNPLFLFAPFGFLLAHFYNDEEGISNRKLAYLMYPVILLIIWAVGYLLF